MDANVVVVAAGSDRYHRRCDPGPAGRTCTLSEDHDPVARYASPLHNLDTAGVVVEWWWFKGDAWNASAAAAETEKRTAVGIHQEELGGNERRRLR